MPLIRPPFTYDEEKPSDGRTYTSKDTVPEVPGEPQEYSWAYGTENQDSRVLSRIANALERIANAMEGVGGAPPPDTSGTFAGTKEP